MAETESLASTQILILPAPRCRRSARIQQYLQKNGIAFRRVDPDTPEGAELAALYDFRASPGILVNGVSINPFDLLVKSGCRVDDGKARQIFSGGGG